MRERLGWRVALVLTGCFDDPPSVGGSDEAAAPTVTLRGTVSGRLVDGAAAITGVRIDVLGAPELFAITTADGSFELADVPAGAPVWLAARPSSTYVGTIVGIDVGYEDIAEIGLPRTSTLDVQQVADALAMQDPGIVIDTGKGGITATAGRTNVMIALDPAPAGSGFYAIDADGNPALGVAASTNFLLPVVVFFNVGPHMPGELEIVASHPDVSCTVPLSQPPVAPDHVTVVPILCG